MRVRSYTAGTMLLALILSLYLALTPLIAFSQVTQGATLTVLRGQVAVVRPDGSAVQPAPTGTVVNAGDEIRTLTRTGALITFFAGTEIEMGEDTILVVERVTQEGARVDVSLRQVLGVTVNRVQALTDPNSSYRIEAGGATAVVRGTTFALIGPVATSQGNIVALVCLDDCSPQTTFAGCPVAANTGFGVTVEGGRVTSGCDTFAVSRGADIWNAAFEAVTTFEQSFANGNNVNNPGGANLGRERGTVRSDERNREQNDQDDDKDAQPVVVASPVPVGSPGPTTTLSGVVTNALTGQPIAGATVQVDGTSVSAITGSDGRFTLAGVPAGQRVLRVSAPGFATATRTITVVEGTNPEILIALAPVSATGDITIVLTWGAEPRDLDSHLSGPNRTGGRFHVYFADSQAPSPSPYATLDRDDVTSFGPETVRITRDPTTGQFVAGEYRYWVHNFSGSPEFNVSNARVNVFKGSDQLAEFDVANASGDPSLDVWRVANLTVDASGNVSITPVQQFTSGEAQTIFGVERDWFALPPGSSPAPTEK